MGFFEEFEFPGVRHYYGDAVRALFISAAVMMVVLSPLYTADLKAQAPIIVVGVVVLVALAAITNPNKSTIMMMDAVAAGIGLAFYGTWALTNYNTEPPLAFVLRGAIALILLFAFYFSLKTARAMMMGRLGKHDQVGEFYDDDQDEKRDQQKQDMKNHKMEIESDT